MANVKGKERYFITIPENPLNAGKEQTKMIQIDGVTYEIKVGMSVEVPREVAIRAKEIGYVTDYTVVA
jgi:hypothetical protein